MASSSPPPTDYCQEYLPPHVVEKLEAGAFRSLCQHLQERSDDVSNMELMTLSGFCRNCLAKWMVMEARRLVDSDTLSDADNANHVVQALNAMGYDEAAQHVYGMNYSEWKKRHQKKATDEQMERYNASKPLQAVHDKNLLATRADKPDKPLVLRSDEAQDTTKQGNQGATSTLLSNVCCQDVEAVAAQPPARDTRTLAPFEPPPLPTTLLDKPITMGILTVSDRAFRNEYETGDLSGPAVAKAVSDITKGVETNFAIVPDDDLAIQSKLKEWCTQGLDLIFTTGGTGMSPRDVTPEATRAVLDLECGGLMTFCATECSRLQPLASLSRGTAGIRGKSLIANLPGNPKGVCEVVPILLPLLLHAMVDLQQAS